MEDWNQTIGMIKCNFEESNPTRASLIGRLKDWDDQAGWQEFFDTYWRLIYGTALKAGLSDAEAQDVVQDTILTVAKAMPAFDYDPARGSFKSWLRKTTHWRIRDHWRRRSRHPAAERPAEDDSRTPAVERIPDPASLEPDAAWEADWQQNFMDSAIERVKHQVKPQQYQLFDCYVVKGWPMKELTQKLHVSMAQVYFAKLKITGLIQKELRVLERKWK
jgi:RNA polymerase sigma factor (sigma-70 family)